MHSSVVALFWISLAPIHASTAGVAQAFAPGVVAERSQNRWIQMTEIDDVSHFSPPAQTMLLPHQRRQQELQSLSLRASSSGDSLGDTQIQEDSIPTVLSIECAVDASRLQLSLSKILKAIWYGQELLTTFSDGEIDAVSVVLANDNPVDIHGFLLRLSVPSPDGESKEEHILWHRTDQINLASTSEGEDDEHAAVNDLTTFPSTKQIKQKIRDFVAPSQFLGHSDTSNNQETQQQQTSPAVGAENESNVDNTCVTCNETESTKDTTRSVTPTEQKAKSVAEPSKPNQKERGTQPRMLRIDDIDQASHPSISITYCTGCRWLPRAAYLAQEILLDSMFVQQSTIEKQPTVASIVLIPSIPPFKGGQFTVMCDGKPLFDRKDAGRFPEVDEILYMLHVTLNDEIDSITAQSSIEELDDDNAAEARKFFGVL